MTDSFVTFVIVGISLGKLAEGKLLKKCMLMGKVINKLQIRSLNLLSFVGVEMISFVGQALALITCLRILTRAEL